MYEQRILNLLKGREWAFAWLKRVGKRELVYSELYYLQLIQKINRSLWDGKQPAASVGTCSNSILGPSYLLCLEYTLSTAPT